MFRNHRARLFLLCCLATPLANAANIDLTTFTLRPSGDVVAIVNSNYAYLDPGSSISSAYVHDISSFEWKFSASTTENALSFFDAPAFSAFPTLLATTDTVGGNGSTFWKTYTFATAYTGALGFGAIGPLHTAAVLELRNVSDSVKTVPPSSPVIPAVPEPESYAMLIAGLGLMASIGHRRAKRATRPAVQA